MQHFINTIRRTLHKIISYQPKKKMEKQMNRLIQPVRICHVTSTTFAMYYQQRRSVALCCSSIQSRFDYR